MRFSVPADAEAVAIDGSAFVEPEARVVGLFEDGMRGFGDEFGED